MFKRIFVAKRSEIAVRVTSSSREMGRETVAVCHEVDKEGLFVHYADFAIVSMAIYQNLPIWIWIRMPKHLIFAIIRCY